MSDTCLCTLQSVSGEGKNFNAVEMSVMIHWLQSDDQSAQDAAFDAQLDAHHGMGAIGTHFPQPKAINGWSPGICRVQWSCIKQPCRRLLFALSAALGLIITVGDATNAFLKADELRFEVTTHECISTVDPLMVDLSWCVA